MKTPQNFKVYIFPKNKNTLVSALNPTGEYYYRIKTPTDLYRGLWCGRIAFYDINNDLIYHKQNQLAQFGMNLLKPWEIVAWSSSGTMAYFVERNSVDACWHVLLDCKSREVCRVDYEETEKELFETISQGDFDDNIIKANLFLEFGKFTPEKIEYSIAEFFGFGEWLPK